MRWPAEGSAEGRNTTALSRTGQFKHSSYETTRKAPIENGGKKPLQFGYTPPVSSEEQGRIPETRR